MTYFFSKKVMQFFLLVLTSLLFFTGCSTYQTLDTSQQETLSIDSLNSGDEIFIRTKDGAEYNFVVAEVTDTFVRGPEQDIAVVDIDYIGRKEISPVRTATVGYIILSVLTAIWLVNKVEGIN